MLAAHFDEGFVGTLDDALRADVDPAARRHLAIHHQALAIEFVEVLPRRPRRHQVGVGQQNARSIRMRLEDAHRLARLDQQGLVIFQRAQRPEDGIVARPITRCSADTTIDHQLGWVLGDISIQIILDHPIRRLGKPALAAEHVTAWSADHARWVVA